MIQEFDGDAKMNKTKEECESYVLENERKRYWIRVSRDSEEIEKAVLMISLDICAQ